MEMRSSHNSLGALIKKSAFIRVPPRPLSIELEFGSRQ
jgi:hypothetical protein